MLRRLPVYLLVDCSESMAGKAIEDVKHGIHSMLSALKRDPHAMESAYISIITFDTTARVLLPLSELSQVQTPDLVIHPGTAMGAALKLLTESIKRDVKTSSSKSKGDYRPIAFILTDGVPTDEWQNACKSLKDIHPKLANIYAIGCGDEVDFSVLSKITENCIHVKNVTASTLANIFVWLSASVQSQSVSLNPDEGVNLSKVPLKDGMELVDLKKLPKTANNPRLFIHFLCQNHKKYFLSRFKYLEREKLYRFDESVKLPDNFFSQGEAKGESIKSTSLYDLPICPYCESTGFAQCNKCGTLFCTSYESDSGTCPKCGTKLYLIDGHFNFDGSQG